MPSIFIFTGPTLSHTEAATFLKAHFLPPVAQGDLFRITQYAPVAIGIIDGFFHNTPSVWHKEVLWALSKGIHVFGSASMGALRASELEAFGMVGIGKIFKKFRDGEWEDDDEVAVVHGPEELNFKASTEAMANIRFTMQKAMEEGIIDEYLRIQLESIGKSLFYPDRTYSRLFHEALEADQEQPDLENLRNWVQEHSIDQKKEDAIEMLKIMARAFQENSQHEPKQIQYSFSYTEMFDQGVRASVPSESLELGYLEIDTQNLILDELRLNHLDFNQFFNQAAARTLMIEETYRLGLRVSDAMRENALNALRATQFKAEEGGIPQELRNESKTDYLNSDILDKSARHIWMENLFRKEIITQIPVLLKTKSAYQRYYQRSKEKQDWLESTGSENPSLLDFQMRREEILQWHFTENLGCKVPDNLEAFIQALGLDDVEDYLQILLREYAFRTKGKGGIRSF